MIMKNDYEMNDYEMNVDEMNVDEMNVDEMNVDEMNVGVILLYFYGLLFREKGFKDRKFSGNIFQLCSFRLRLPGEQVLDGPDVAFRRPRDARISERRQRTVKNLWILTESNKHATARALHALDRFIG
jgi:hypothetical protein